MSGLRWLQILLLLVIAQPLVLLAIPCHTGGTERVDASSVRTEHHFSHHFDRSQPHDTDSLSFETLSPRADHGCCGAGNLCLMSSCAASVTGFLITALHVLPPSAAFQRYRPSVPDAPVSPHYRPPIVL